MFPWTFILSIEMIGRKLFFAASYVFVLLALCTQMRVMASTSSTNYNGDHCLEKERLALLKFKDELIDDYGRLETWGSMKDCCEWNGVRCDNRTNHVVVLDLPAPKVDNFFLSTPLRGKISSSLLRLSELKYLDLSNNDFNTIQIPEYIGSLEKLQHLNLSHSNFVGPLPYRLGNLSMLRVLDLSGNEDIDVTELDWLPGLRSLQHLDLSGVNLFQVATWMESISTLKELEKLFLRSCLLQETLGNISLPSINGYRPLSVLDLSSNSLGNISVFWFLNFSRSLSYFDLSSNNVEGKIPGALSGLKALSYLDLSFNSFGGTIPGYLGDMMSLVYLDLSVNNLEGKIPDSLGNMMFLVHLDLSGNKLEGGIPSSLGKMVSLSRLNLAGNNLQGGIPPSSGNLSSLTSFDLSENKWEGQVADLIMFLWNSNMLEYLDLSSNSFYGSIPPLSRYSFLRIVSLERNGLNGSFIEKKLILPHLLILDVSGNRLIGSLPDLSSCSSLEVLNLADNLFNGTLTESIGYLSNLDMLDIHINQFEGTISEAHFFNISQLGVLDLSYNLNLSVNISPQWNPLFQLGTLKLQYCKLGPSFPRWIEKQRRVAVLDLSNSEIYDSIPGWFWENSHSLQYLNLSFNHVHGILPNLSSYYNLSNVDFSSNEFDGSLPLFPSSHMEVVDLSKNKFSGEAAKFCNATYGWTVLDLSENQLTGELSVDCFKNLMTLDYLNLANNNFSGEIPNPDNWFCSLASLHLRNNNFMGELPRSLTECNRLQIIDLGENHFTGKIPTWIGDSLTELGVLSLRSNELRGSLPATLCHLANIQILDLSINKISGTIPRCLSNFTTMSSKPNISEENGLRFRLFPKAAASFDDSAYLTWKGREAIYTKTLALVKVIDLSSNMLVGKIPSEITSLEGIIGLNLSRNNLVGSIPNYIGQLEFLNFLDLSENNLSGGIPITMSNMSHLGLLDLSFNNLSGKIPWDGHLQTFGASTYTGNPGLCGPPLIKPCPGDETPKNNEAQTTGETHDLEKEDGFISLGFFVSLALGFIIAFWGVIGTLMLNSSCSKVFDMWKSVIFRQ
ncbi:receptor-like protein EIX2 [Primulina eburnea]|uniref:receptor-like protein EIX2 n=1 Tax=Primulina eburnea TaxID=1245227 RepID=UPI003C6C12BE